TRLDHARHSAALRRAGTSARLGRADPGWPGDRLLLRPARRRRRRRSRHLPEIEQAATIVHHGSMDNVLATIQVLARWIDENGYRSAGYPRDLYLECP